MANDVRNQLASRITDFLTSLNSQLKKLVEDLVQCRKANDFADKELQFFNEELKRMEKMLNKLLNFNIRQKSTSFIGEIYLEASNSVLLLPSDNLNATVKWIQNAVCVAGGNGYGTGINQLAYPYGLFVDDDNQTIYIADSSNHRIMAWECGSTTGRVVAGGNGQGNRADQLNYPRDVIVDRARDSLIICDNQNKRVVRWPRQNSTSGETIITNVECWGLTMDDNGFLYVVDYDKHEVRRYGIEDTQGTVVAGGNGQGNHLDQLNNPRYVFVDRDHTVYVSDLSNHRVMKWMEDAKQGIVVAGGQGQGSALTQLSYPDGMVVDESGTVYVSDCGNCRIMRWPEGATQGSIIAGGNGLGDQANQLNLPTGLSSDRQGNLYVSDHHNHRVQKFNIDRSE
ncbi:unnamed protein product [Rotaria sp. Silwood1]|nr:unnamed protein product [Rotaria sp. Silwood1]